MLPFLSLEAAYRACPSTTQWAERVMTAGSKNLKATTTLVRILVEGRKQMCGKRNNATDAYYQDVPVSFMN